MMDIIQTLLEKSVNATFSGDAVAYAEAAFKAAQALQTQRYTQGYALPQPVGTYKVNVNG